MGRRCRPPSSTGGSTATPPGPASSTPRRTPPTPAARGRGVFSTLELHNEQEAADAGAQWALGFTNPMAGPILVGKLGWEDVTSLRIWARPKRLRRRGQGGLRVAAGVEPFAASPLRGEHHVIRDAAHLSWRYVE